jgi:uncharacterized protein YdeI (BOF family)
MSSITAGGNVDITSNTETTTSVDATTLVNSAPATKKKSSKSIRDTTLAQGISIAVTDSITESTTTVEKLATIEAAGSVNVHATGTVENEASASTYVFLDGSGAIGIAVGKDQSEILTTVNGSIKAGAVRIGDPGSDKIDGSSFDLLNDTITLSDHGFESGQEILLAGETYRVNVLDENTIQLAHGSAIELDARGTDPNAMQSLSRSTARTFEPASAVNHANNSITLPAHGLTTGQQVSYHALTTDGAEIGGLFGGANYFVLRLDADHIKLGTDVEPEGLLSETFTVGTTTYYVVDFADASALQTAVSFDPTGTTSKGENVFDDGSDSIVFSVDPDFYSGQPVTYSAATPIDGLTSGATYYVIRVAGALDRVQLATTKATFVQSTECDR